MINVHIYPSQFDNESRILKITSSLAKLNFFDKIYMIGVLDSENKQKIEKVDDVRTILRVNRFAGNVNSSTIIKTWKTLVWYINVLLLLKEEKILCINCHSLPVLPLCVFLKLLNKNSKLIYDTHELETETNGLKWLKKIIYKVIEYLFINNANIIVVVSEGIAKWYQTNYKIQKPSVIENVPIRQEIDLFDKKMLKNRLGLNQEDILFIYQGNLSKGRGIEELLNIFSKEKSKYIVFIGNGPLEYLVKSNNSPNIFHINSVPMVDLIKFSIGADVGVSLTENTSLSYFYSLPNKIFEYLIAGLPIIISDLPEQKAILKKYSCGWCVKDGQLLKKLVAEININDIRVNKNNVIKNTVNIGWHNEESKLVTIYNELFYKN